jgi:hypothetical protein
MNSFDSDIYVPKQPNMNQKNNRKFESTHAVLSGRGKVTNERNVKHGNTAVPQKARECCNNCGTAKDQQIREINASGGFSEISAYQSANQFRMLNATKKCSYEVHLHQKVQDFIFCEQSHCDCLLTNCGGHKN